MDEAPSDYRAFHTLSGQAATWRFAERFVDGRLVGTGETAVEEDSWAASRPRLSNSNILLFS